jgi:hypothetical protein
MRIPMVSMSVPLSMMKSTDIEAGEKMAELNGYFNGTSDPFRVYG